MSYEEMEEFFDQLYRGAFEDDMATLKMIYETWDDKIALMGAMKLCSDHEQPMPQWLVEGLIKHLRKRGAH